MAGGQVGRRGVVAQPAFAREISAFEQGHVPIHCQVQMELFVRARMQSSWIV